MSEEYDYLAVIVDRIREWMNDRNSDVSEYVGLTKHELYQKMIDDLWAEDSVTGNGSGSYTFNRWEARDNVLNGGMDHVKDMVSEGWMNKDQFVDWVLEDDWESIDVSIRCYLLGQAIDVVLMEDWPSVGWHEVIYEGVTE